MRVIVAGSRDFNDYDLVEKTLLTYFKAHHLHNKDVEIVSGSARGADKLGEQFAKKCGLKLTKFPADWNKYGKAAGPIRNEEMAKYSDMLFAFWDGYSKGTKNMIELAKQYELLINVSYI